MTRFNNRLRNIFFDLVASTLTWVCFVFYFHLTDSNSNTLPFPANLNILTTWGCYFLICCLFTHALSGIYLYPEKQTQHKNFLTTAFSSFFIGNTFFFFLNLCFPNFFSLKYLFFLFIALFLFTIIIRSIIVFIKDLQQNKEENKIKTAVVGIGKNAEKIALEIKEKLKKNVFLGFIAEKQNINSEIDLQLLGTMSEIDSIIKKNDIKEIIIALDEKNEKNIFAIIAVLLSYNIEIEFVPGLYDIITGRVRIRELGVTPLVSITTPSMTDWEICVKRFSDIFLSSLAVIFLSPLFLLLIILIKKDSYGSAFFFQERIGKGGKPFNLIKFRTMYKNAESKGPQLSSPEDKRITKIGGFLRKHRFDELPQLWNVLVGDMSIVGPRPEREYYIKQITEVAPYFCLTYKVRPGLTSWGPIRIGYSDTIEKMVDRLNYDIIYIDNMSLKTDINIVLRTIKVILGGKGF